MSPVIGNLGGEIFPSIKRAFFEKRPHAQWRCRKMGGLQQALQYRVALGGADATRYCIYLIFIENLAQVLDVLRVLAYSYPML